MMQSGRYIISINPRLMLTNFVKFNLCPSKFLHNPYHFSRDDRDDGRGRDSGERRSFRRDENEEPPTVRLNLL
jgi:hypothetical protein